MEPVKFTYFNGRGFGERIRIMLCFTGIKFQQRFMDFETREDFLNLIQDTPLLFGQVPLLEIDGLKMYQSNAIVRYLADREGLAGKAPADKFKIDALTECCRDFQMAFMLCGFAYSKEKVKEDCEKQHFKKYLPAFERTLKETGTNCLYGDSTSMADLALFEVLMFVEEMWTPDEDPLKDHPNLKQFMENMKSKPQIKYYLENYRTQDNYRVEYTTNVCKVLDMTFG